MGASVGSIGGSREGFESKVSDRNYRWEPRRVRVQGIGGNREGFAFAPKSQQHLPNKQNPPSKGGGVFVYGGIGGI